MIVLFHKPYNILSQFSATSDHPLEETLGAFGLPPHIYPVGRLDKDSEGLMILSDEAKFIGKISHPQFEKKKYYWVEVEGQPRSEDLSPIVKGLTTPQMKCRPGQFSFLDESTVLKIPPRIPPVRFRKNIPTTWIEIVIVEGQNRQVRKMTASLGFPTLRLIRTRIENLFLYNLTLEDLWVLKPGQWKILDENDRKFLF